MLKYISGWFIPFYRSPNFPPSLSLSFFLDIEISWISMRNFRKRPHRSRRALWCQHVIAIGKTRWLSHIRHFPFPSFDRKILRLSPLSSSGRFWRVKSRRSATGEKSFRIQPPHYRAQLDREMNFAIYCHRTDHELKPHFVHDRVWRERPSSLKLQV